MKSSRKLVMVCLLLLLSLPAQARGETQGLSPLATNNVAPRGYTEVSTDNGQTWTLLTPGGTTSYTQSTLKELLFKFHSNPLNGTTKTEAYLDGSYALESFHRVAEWSLWAPAYQGRHVLRAHFYYFGSERSDGFHEYIIELSGQTPGSSPPSSPTSPSDPGQQPRVRIGPRVRLDTPFISTKTSKNATFKVSWSATAASGIASYYVRYRPANTRTWTVWKTNTLATSAYFKGAEGRTYYFRVKATDGDGHYAWSKRRKTIVPYDEGANLRLKLGFNSFSSGPGSHDFLGSLRSSYTRGNTLVYRLRDINGVGLITTIDKDRGRAKVYIDGRYIKTIDTYSPQYKPRQRVFYYSFSGKNTHYLKIVNEGTPGRARFDVDAIVAGR